MYKLKGVIIRRIIILVYGSTIYNASRFPKQKSGSLLQMKVY